MIDYMGMFVGDTVMVVNDLTSIILGKLGTVVGFCFANEMRNDYYKVQVRFYDKSECGNGLSPIDENSLSLTFLLSAYHLRVIDRKAWGRKGEAIDSYESVRIVNQKGKVIGLAVAWQIEEGMKSEV